MAINLTGDTVFGFTDEHNVLDYILVDRIEGNLTIKLQGYYNATAYNDGGQASDYYESQYIIANLPTSVKTALVNLKNEIEIALVNSDPNWTNGTRVNDDGTPI